MEEEDNYLRLLPDTKCHNPNPNIYHSTLCNLQWVSNHTRRENSKCTLTWPDTLSMLVDTLSWWVGSWWYRYWTLWLRAMSISVVLYISYTLVGPTTEPRPLATGIVLLAGAIDRKTLFLRWRRRMIVRTILIVIMFFVSTLVVCPITLHCSMWRSVPKLVHQWMYMSRWLCGSYQCVTEGTVTTDSMVAVSEFTTQFPAVSTAWTSASSVSFAVHCTSRDHWNTL